MNRLLQMSEIEREEILSQRLEEKQQLLDKRMLSQMVLQQRNGGTDDSVAKAAKRDEQMSLCCYGSNICPQDNIQQEGRRRRSQASLQNSKQGERRRMSENAYGRAVSSSRPSAH